MSLRQEVALARDTSIHLITGTWGDGGPSRAGFDKGAELETFAYYVDRFVKDWQTAKSSQPAAAPPEPTPAGATDVRLSARDTGTAGPGGPDTFAREPATAAGSDNPDAVRGIQTALRDTGYDVGAVDGRLGQRTRAAIRAFERDHGLPVTGLASRSVLERLIARRAELPP
jgi:peptidoglycan hydrolase-like protein with peptidoglycan-binding domain